jgi:hypothetical protein
MAEQAFDPVALFVKFLVVTDRLFAIGSRGNDGLYVPFFQVVPNGIAVIAFICQKRLWVIIDQRHQVFVRRAVCRFAAREVEDERQSVGRTETMNFTGEPAPRAAKSLSESPPFAPAPDTWPRTVVLSIL